MRLLFNVIFRSLYFSPMMLEFSYVQRLVAVLQDTPLEKLDKKHFAKGSRGSAQNGAAVAPQQIGRLKEIAFLEAKLKKLSDLLSEVGICCLTIHAHLFSCL